MLEEDLIRRVLARYKSKVTLDSGNTVYQYSARQVALRNRRKAEQIAKLEKKLSELRNCVRKDLTSKNPQKALTALAVALMDETYERVGNPESAEDGHFGVTGWLRKHVSFGKNQAKIRYVGKSGVEQEKTVSSSAIVRALRDAYDRIEDAEGSILEGTDSQKVNDYLAKFGVTAKDIRGLHANKLILQELRKERKKGGKLPDDKKEREAKLKEEFKAALEVTAEAIGHEPSTLRSQYLVPSLESEFTKDGTITTLTKTAAESSFLTTSKKGGQMTSDRSSYDIVLRVVARSIHAAKKPTFAEVRKVIFDHLRKEGWKLVENLKIPHATSPDGHTRLWFKPQAVYGDHSSRPDFASAHSWIMDLREYADPNAFMRMVERWVKSHYEE